MIPLSDLFPFSASFWLVMMVAAIATIQENSENLNACCYVLRALVEYDGVFLSMCYTGLV